MQPNVALMRFTILFLTLGVVALCDKEKLRRQGKIKAV
jgi:hypothetical protein